MVVLDDQVEKLIKKEKENNMPNTRRMNRLEELGRVDAEKARTRKGKRNLKDEKRRLVRELKAKGGKTKKSFPDLTGDGKVTRADVLKGRGVFAKGSMVRRIGVAARGAGPDMGRRPRKRGNPAVMEPAPRKRMPQMQGKPRKKMNDKSAPGIPVRDKFSSGGVAIRGRGCEIK